MTSDPWMKRLLANIGRAKRQYDLVQGEATVESLRRFRWMAVFTVPLHFVLAAWFAGYTAPSIRPELVRWADALSSVHATTGGIVLVLALFVHWLLQPRGRATAAGVALHGLLCVTYLVFGVITSAIDIGAAAPGGLSSYIMVCIVVAMISLMRPALALPLFIGGLLAFGLMLDASRVDRAMLSSLVINAVAVTFLAIVTSVIAWRQYVKNYVLRHELTAANDVLIAKQRELEGLSERDLLTGLYHRQRVLQLLETELARALRSPQELSLVMLSLDNFQPLREQWGHPAGDELLRQTAALLAQTVRSTDIVARIGADEFMLLLPNTDRDNAMTVAEKLRMQLRRMPARWPGQAAPITASLGVTALAFNELATVDALYAAADRALYAAQQSGRDRVAYVAPKTSGQLSTFPRVAS